MHAVQYHLRSNLVPRLQWNANSGYCGETSFICAGLRLGQYCSQWTARKLFINVSGGGLEQSNPNSQLLLLDEGDDADLKTANEMRLQASKFPGTNGAPLDLIRWAKRELVRGHVPIIGVFNNGIVLGEWNGRTDGDPDYDHIVPVVGFASNYPLHEDDYHPSDVITLSDNGLYGPVGRPERYPFLFSYEAQGFQGTREQANDPAGAPLYMLRNRPPVYGVSIEGVVDHDGVCIPVHLSCDRYSEPKPEERKSAGEPSDGDPITLTATVELPPAGEHYNLYCYTRFVDVPGRNFNAYAKDHPDNVIAWNIQPGLSEGSTVQSLSGKGPPLQVTRDANGLRGVVVYDANSDDTVVFRAVPASAA